MSNPVIAVYPGTFDPITLGHQDLIRRAAGLFGTVIVAVAEAHHKKTMFSLEERLESVREVLKPYANVQVEAFSGLVRDFAVDHGARAPLGRFFHHDAVHQQSVINDHKLCLRHWHVSA